MKLDKREIETRLKAGGYRLTPQRRAVIRATVASKDHLTPAALHRKLKEGNRKIGLVTIYRTLEILERLGLICEVHAGGDCRSYTGGARWHHHHITCTSCHRVVDFTDCGLGELERRLSRETGFEISEHLLQFSGLCRQCREDIAGKVK